MEEASRLGPAAPGSTVQVSATCPSGTAPVGGGASTLLVSGRMPPSSLHVLGSFPVAAEGGTRVASWVTIGATGGQLVFGGQTTSLVVCTDLNLPPLQVVLTSAAGPARSATISKATATCPPGATLVSGGADVSAPASSPSLHLIGSFPSLAAGAPAPQGSTPASWTAIADAGGRGGSGIRITAYAVCGTGSRFRPARLAVADVPGPRTASTAMSATARCAAGTTLLGGGVNTGLPSGQAPQQGIHLTGSFPSLSSGQVAAAGTRPTGWTARAESGGQPTPNIVTTSYALCAAVP
ncbi:MAG TPA: hypothetical protein VHT30_10545 [Acidimicrobiales bacterium]|nr:hypothetical protein [Acidimicrobiales bacterium]